MSQKQQIDDLELLRQLKSLPNEVQPEHDLWPTIEDRLQVHPSRVNRWLTGAVAASILVSVGLTVFLVKSQQQISQLQEQSVVAQSHNLQQVEQQYQLAKAGLLTELSKIEAFSSEPSREALEKQLDLIDAAIKQIKQAMQQEPNNPFLAQMLVNTYQQQLTMLEKLSNSRGIEVILI